MDSTGLQGVPLAVSFTICLLMALVGNAWAGDALRTWYPKLIKPKGMVPLWAFVIVGVTVYVIDGVVLYRLLAYCPSREGAVVSVTATIVVMAYNEAWNYAFFGMRSTLASWIAILGFVAPMINLMTCLALFEPVSAILMVPYCVWLLYDLWWVYRLWRLNTNGLS